MEASKKDKSGKSVATIIKGYSIFVLVMLVFLYGGLPLFNTPKRFVPVNLLAALITVVVTWVVVYMGLKVDRSAQKTRGGVKRW